jgi:hypothetical protein
MAFPKIRKTYASWARRYQKIHRLVDSPFSYSQRKPVAIQIAGRLACTFLDYKIRAFARLQAGGRKARMVRREHSRHTAVGADNTQKQYERMIFQLYSLGICAALIHCSNDKVERILATGVLPTQHFLNGSLLICPTECRQPWLVNCYLARKIESLIRDEL